jgi:hypothetical protein
MTITVLEYCIELILEVVKVVVVSLWRQEGGGGPKVRYQCWRYDVTDPRR